MVDFLELFVIVFFFLFVVALCFSFFVGGFCLMIFPHFFLVLLYVYCLSSSCNCSLQSVCVSVDIVTLCLVCGSLAIVLLCGCVAIFLLLFCVWRLCSYLANFATCSDFFSIGTCDWSFCGCSLQTVCVSLWLLCLSHRGTSFCTVSFSFWCLFCHFAPFIIVFCLFLVASHTALHFVCSHFSSFFYDVCVSLWLVCVSFFWYVWFFNSKC